MSKFVLVPLILAFTLLLGCQIKSTTDLKKSDVDVSLMSTSRENQITTVDESSALQKEDYFVCENHRIAHAVKSDKDSAKKMKSFSKNCLCTNWTPADFDNLNNRIIDPVDRSMLPESFDFPHPDSCGVN